MIQIEHLSKYYDSQRAVDDLSLEINSGEIIGLLGPNGAGKTTTMRILTCYIRPTSGTIRVGGYDILEDSWEIKSKIGYLPESAPLYPDMITYDYLSYVASVRGISGERVNQRIEELVDLCGLHGVMHKSVKELSRGYKQRVGLAHAMMSDPEILVLDEPTAGLDPNQIVEIRSIIRKMGTQKTVIFSTHILSEAEATCDRIAIINEGKLVADGTPQSLGANGLTAQVIRVGVRGVKPTEVRARLSSVPGVRDVAVSESSSDQDTDVVAQVFCDGDLRPELYTSIKGSNWMLVEFAKERQSLESTFRALTLAEGEREVQA